MKATTHEKRPERFDGLPEDSGYIEQSGEVGPWRVSLTWLASLPGSGPVKIVIEPAPGATLEDFQRGLTSGALRNIEAEVVKSTAKVAEQLGPVTQRAGQLLHDIHTAMQPYREGKAIDATYYQGLLVMYEMFTAMGDRSPVQTLASQLERKPETIRTQLKKARKLAAESVEGES